MKKEDEALGLTDHQESLFRSVHVLRSNPVPDAKRFQIDFLIISSCYENTVLFAQYATLIQITLQ